MSASIPIKPAAPRSYPKRPGTKPGRVDLIPEEFEALLDDQGTRVRITPSILCPNRTELGDTNHVLDCPLCFEAEVIDLKGECFETWAFIQGIDLQKEMQVSGIFDMKDAKITVKQGVRLYYWYKIEVLDFASVFNQIIKREAGDKDRLRYVPADTCDTPHFCMGSDGVKYVLNEDYTIIDQELRWDGLKRPASGSLFSITYPVLPTFRVIEFLHENRYYYTSFKSAEKIPVQLPQQALIRWDYIAKKSGSQVENK